ncbi:MAG: hypothetical protein KA714_30670 [Limnoraphis sp. WC205]|jgi:hypothetical protein|nr:hypothetical protein [Limnoraphis sp. WC205]
MEEVEFLNEHGLDELTDEFLESVNYPDVHMSWSEWESKAKEFGLEESQIWELQSYLENNNQLTVRFMLGKSLFWLTQREIKHIELLKQQFPDNWEYQVEWHMQRKTLGDLDAR